MSDDGLPGLMTRVDAAEYLRVSLPTLHRLIRAGKVRAVKIGGVTRITADGLKMFVAGASRPQKG